MEDSACKRKSRERADRDEFHFIEYDVDEGLPFSNSFFDAVSCIAVLEHVFNPPNVVDEIHRVLKPGGVFVVQVPNIAWVPYRIQLLFGKLPTTGGVYLDTDWEHLHLFTKSTIYQLLMKKGFNIESVSCSGILARYRRWYPSALGADLIIKAVKD